MRVPSTCVARIALALSPIIGDGELATIAGLRGVRIGPINRAGNDAPWLRHLPFVNALLGFQR